MPDTPIAQAIKKEQTADAYWLRSFYAQQKGNLYCLWDAKSADDINKVLKKATPDFPSEGPYELPLIVESEDFR